MNDGEIVTDGWDAIAGALERLHGAEEQWHIAGMPPLALGGDFQGMSAYAANDNWHLVTFALSELWAKENSDPEWSGMGFELTARVPFTPDAPPAWLPSVVSFVCRWVRTSGTVVEDGHFLVLPDWLPAKGWARPWPAVAFVLDPQLGAIDTPNGRVEFLQLVSLSQRSLEELLAIPPGDTEMVRERVRARVRLDHPDDALYISPSPLS